MTLADFKDNEQRTKIEAPVIRALSFYTFYTVHGSLILEEIILSVRRLSRGIISPDNVSATNLTPLQFPPKSRRNMPTSFVSRVS